MKIPKLTLAYARQLAQQCFEQAIKDDDVNLQGDMDDLAGHIFDSGMNEDDWYDVVERADIDISSLFNYDWSETEQGYDFWSDIEDGELIPPHK